MMYGSNGKCSVLVIIVFELTCVYLNTMQCSFIYVPIQAIRSNALAIQTNIFIRMKATSTGLKIRKREERERQKEKEKELKQCVEHNWPIWTLTLSTWFLKPVITNALKLSSGDRVRVCQKENERKLCNPSRTWMYAVMRMGAHWKKRRITTWLNDT